MQHNIFLVNTTNPTKSINSSNDPFRSHVLLIYVYAANHKYASGNLRYFIETAVRERDGVDYIFILQQTENKPVNETELPVLPKSSAFYIQHENACFDFGTIGWFLDKYTIGNPWKNVSSITNSIDNDDHQRKFNITQYKYFILMNSSIRGPFFPPYFLKFLSDYRKELKKSFYWYHIFTKRINAVVKLSGCTISVSQRPHVQSYLLATDYTGFSILLKTSYSDGIYLGGVFGCYGSKSDTTLASELTISSVILESDYMIDCLLTKYQTIDFSKKRNYQSSVYENPYTDGKMDGTSLEPYEVVFVKFNDREGTTQAQERAKLYQRWSEEAKIANRSVW